MTGRAGTWADLRYASALVLAAAPLAHLVSRPDWGPAAAAGGVCLLLALVVPRHWLPVAALYLVAAEPTLLEVGGVPSAAVKAAAIGVAGLAVLRGGPASLSGAGAGFLATWALALAWSLLLSPDPYSLGASGMATAWAGFLSGWAFLLVRVEPQHRGLLLRCLVVAPAVVTALGLLAWPVIGRAPLVLDHTGVPRLQGLSIPPHLAMLAFVAVLAALLALRAVPSRASYAWVVANAGIATATLSRGAIAATAVLLIFGLVLDRVPAARRGGRRAAVLVLGAVGAVAVVGALQRSEGNDYEGPVNTSGRLQAWRFFLEVGDRAPWTGNGLGASSVANGVETPDGVQAAFFAPHNEFIHLYVDAGVVAGAAILAALAVLLWSGIRRAAGVPVAVGAMGGAVVLASLDNPISTPGVTLMLALLLAVPSTPKGGDHGHEPVVRPGRHRAAPGPERPAVHRGGARQLPA